MHRFLSAMLLISCAASAQVDPTQLANRIVTSSIKVKPGQAVVIFGGKHTVGWMEALAIEAEKAGGQTTLFLNTDRIMRSRFTEVPEQYLGQPPMYFAEWLKHVDVWIGLPGIEDAKAVFADIPEARFEKAAKAGQVVDNMLNDSPIKAIFINLPTEQSARNDGIEFARLQEIIHAGMMSDHEQIASLGNRLKDRLSAAKVHVTSPNGTDFTFETGQRPIFVDDGMLTEEKAKSKLALGRFVSLPGGVLSVAPIEESANGKVVVPRTTCRWEPMTNVQFELKGGKLQRFQAEKGGDCFEKSIAPYASPKDRFGYFSIGLNPGIGVVENPGDYRPDNGAGVIWMGVGDNRLMGGANDTVGGFSFPILNATVEVNGKTVIKAGKLTD